MQEKWIRDATEFLERLYKVLCSDPENGLTILMFSAEHAIIERLLDESPHIEEPEVGDAF